ncbi:MAG: N-acetyl-gamma-glutamyl-phosphate reductase [Candidatus Saganbacteria bacterium]|nr:N-acetyl-gamma-glutamyl-phosphate reductase [Candidatus Saganbacteria bacterium]
MKKIGIIGAGGYAGETLVGLLLRHPEVKIEWLMSEPAHKGLLISELYPHLKGETDLVCLEINKSKISEVDLVYLAMPHGIGFEYIKETVSKGKKVIDLSADFRLHNVAVYEKWYVKHTEPGLLAEAVYGLPELHREEIKKAKIVANPGCYTTASILALAPLAKEKLIEFSSIGIDAKSGVSGAGIKLTRSTHFSDVNEGVTPYSALTHRHTPEIDQELSLLAGKEVKVSFLPHLIPMTRGILSTCYTKAVKKVSQNEIIDLYKGFFKSSVFVRIFDGDKLPSTKYVYGTNYCDLAVRVNQETNQIIVFSAVDNLVRGASGQAVHNMNTMYGFPEKTGIDSVAVYP